MKITILGAGNVGYHLAQRLYNCGHQIIQVLSRQKEKAIEVTDIVGGQAIQLPSEISTDADVYILCIKDDNIKSLAEEIIFLNDYNKIVVHTSGATPSDVLTAYFHCGGVFYPLQTFTRDRPANFENLPLCVYSPDKTTEDTLEALAGSICPNVYRIDDEQRRVLHVGAVFVNNMTNYLFMVGEDICRSYKLPFDLLRPLIRETVQKIENRSPSEMQTGPARRGDQATLERHLAFLERNGWRVYREIYDLLSKAIADSF